MTTKNTVITTSILGTIGLATISWLVVVRQMNGMDMGSATMLGSFSSFILMWMVMMAAMMLPGITPAVLKYAHKNTSIFAVLKFIAQYLLVWSIFGIIVYLLYRPHGSFAAVLFVICAGVYEFMPVKKACRWHCCEDINSGLRFGIYCVGSSIGLMLMQVALGIMSITWMTVIAIIIVAQKLLRPNPKIDIPVAVAIIVLGILILFFPSKIPTPL